MPFDPENPYQRVPDDSPERCQAVTNQGQCHLISQSNSKYCVIHSGSFDKKKAAEDNLRSYRLGVWHSRVAEKANSSQVKDIRDEIGILRLVLESYVNRCKDESDLMMMSQPISELTTKLSTMIEKLHKMETNLGQMIHADQAAQLMDDVVQVIDRHVELAETKEAIANDLYALLAKLTGG